MAKRTFAQEAKSITNKYKLRLGEKFDKGDALALAAMNAELEGLQAKQEAVRAKELSAETQEFAYGGLLPMYLDGGDIEPRPINAGIFNQGIGGVANQMPFNPGVYDKLPGTPAAAMAAQTGSQSALAEAPGFKSRVPWVGAAANMVGSFLANRKIDLPEYNYEEWKPTQARANLVDYSRGREQTLTERDQANALITRNARGTGSQSGLMENILAGVTGTQRAAGQAFNQSLENEGNVNAQIKNQTSQFNAAQAGQAAQLNSRNQLYANQLDRENVMFNEQRRGNRIGAITDSISGYTKDRMAANQFDQQVNMVQGQNPNFNLSQDRSSLFNRIFQFTDPAEIKFRNTNDRALNV